jgi:cytosine/adenosine deaminase-related metal-dependent hydrolase
MKSFALALGSVSCLLLAACSQPTDTAGSQPLPSSGVGVGYGGYGGGGAGAGAGAAGGAGGVGGAGGASTTTTTSTTTTSSTTGSGGGGNVATCDGEPTGDETIVKAGASDKLLLQGTIVTPDQVIQGELLVEGDTITCVAPSCSNQAGAATATVVATNGIILPGLIDTHNHILFDIFDETDWSPSQSYSNHNQWTNEARYKAMVDAKQYLNHEGSSVDLNCELEKYGELKGLVAGTTSIAGAATPPSNKACYGTLARTIDQTPNGLPSDKVQMATLFPNQNSADGVCTNFTSGKTEAYFIHVGEGVDATALNEFTKLGTITSTDGCLYDPKTSIVHGTAFGDAELSVMAQHGMSLTWSPRSNVFLYGAGTDLSKTTNVKLALAKGIQVSIAPDWSIGGSQNILDEVRFADQVDNTELGDVITKKMLLEMVTVNPARALGLDAVLGSLEVGKKADIVVLDGDPNNPYDALLAATPGEVRLVLVGGVPLYGDGALGPIAQASPPCEALAFCGRCKFVCVAQSGGGANDKLGQSYADISSALEAGIAAYDDLDLTSWDFAPITPLVKCP